MRALRLWPILLLVGCVDRYQGPRIDVHAHFEPPGAATINRKLGLQDQALRQQMAEAGVRRVVLMAVVPEGTPPQAVHDTLAELAKTHPQQILAVGSLQPELGKPSLEELDRIASLGFRGVRIVPQQSLSTPEIHDFVARAAADHLVVVLDGWSISMDEVGKLALAEPQAKIVVAHLGGPAFTELLSFRQLERYPFYHRNVWFDLSSLAGMYNGSPYLDELRWVCRQVGTDRILFGSDFPLVNMKDAAQAVIDLGFNEEEQRQIFYQNAQALFGLAPAPAVAPAPARATAAALFAFPWLRLR